jgi:uncharacterized repeat protein (TIGR01451 family)
MKHIQLVWWVTLVLLFCCMRPAAAASQSFAAGSYVIDMGVQPQTFANGLKPYGLLQSLMIDHQIPVAWVINPVKSRDGIDFSHNGKDYRGGPFVIAAEFASQALPVIQDWVNNRGLAASVVNTTVSTITVPVYETLTVFPRAVLDEDNGSIAGGYLVNAGVNSSFYRIDLPSGLNTCDDVYTMPHADPTWEDHQNLISFNQQGGFIWAACHAVSVLENVDDPADADFAPDLNFLSNDGLIDFGDHDDGTLPYSYSDAAHPIMQFMGDIDDATQNGSEQIFLPAAGGWRPSTSIAAWDPDHPEVGAGLPSPGQAAAIAYGRGFGSSLNGLVMYEGGHSHNKGDNPDSVAAQRAYLNLMLLTGVERRPLITATIPATVRSLEVMNLDATIVSGDGPYNYFWTSSCGGSFNNPNIPNPVFTAPASDVNIDCILRVTVWDTCTRRSFTAGAVTILGKPNLALTKSDSQDPAPTSGTLTWTLDVVNNGGDASDVTVIDTLPPEVSFVSAVPDTGSCNESAGTVSCSLGSLATGAAASVQITVTLPAAPTSISNTASVSSPDGDLDPDDNVATEDTLVLPEIDLALTKLVAPATVGAGDSASYSLTAINQDLLLTATNVLVTDTLPTGVDFEQATGSGWNCSYAAATRTLTCLLASLAPATSAAISVTVTARTGGTHTNSASVESLDFADSNINDNTASAPLLVLVAADLEIIKTTNKVNAADGNSLVFYLDVTNNGPDTANDVVVMDTLTYSRDKNNAAGFYAFYNFTKYFFTFPDGTRIQGGNTVRQVSHNGMTVSVAYNPATTDALDKADPLPEPADGTPVQISWDISPGLAPGETIRLEFEAKKESDEQAPNTASVSSTTTDPQPGNDSDTILVGKTTAGVNAKYADLEVQKAAALDPQPADDPVALINQVTASASYNYLISVLNNGPEDIPKGDASKGYSSITVIDTLPAGVGYVGYAEAGIDVAHSLPDGSLVNSGDVVKGTWSCSYAVPSRQLSCTYTLDQDDNFNSGRYLEDLLVRVTAPNTTGVITNTASQLAFNVPPAVDSNTWIDPYDHNDQSSWDVEILPLDVDLAVAKSVDNNAPAAPGEQVTFTVTISNTNAAYPNDATSVVIQDPLPAGLTLVSRTLSQGAFGSDEWLLGDLAHGASATMTVTASVDSIGPITNSATLTSLHQTDVVSANNTASATVDVPDADLSMLKTVSTASPDLGGSVTYTIVVTNHGPLATSGVLVVDQFNNGLDIENPATDIAADSGTPSYDPATREISWDLPVMADQAVATLTVTVRVNQPGDLVNTARIAATNLADGDLTNNDSSVLIEVQSAELALTKQVDVAQPGINDSIEFTVTVTNNGLRDATGVQVTDLLPAGLTYLSHSTVNGSYDSGSGIWDIGLLTNGGVASLGVQARVDQLGTLVNTAAITALDQPDPNPNNDTDSVSVLAGGEADIYLTKSVDNPNPAIGNYVNFIVEAINYGPDPATLLVIRDALPGGLDFDTATPSHGSYDPVSGDWDLGAGGLGVGEVATLMLRVRVTGSGTITNTAAVFLAHPADPDLIGNEASASILVPAGVSISGVVWSDVNHDRQQDAGESGIANVTVVLYSVVTATCQSVRTAADGSYSFSGIPSGSYRLIEAATESVPLPAACLPPEQDPAGHVSTTTNTRLLTVTSVDVVNQDFGDFHGSRLQGRVFDDNGSGAGTAHDGLINGAEAGLSGVAVEANNGATLDSTTTGAGGQFTLWIPDTASGSNVDLLAGTPGSYVSVSKSDGGHGDAAPATSLDQVSLVPVAGQTYGGLNFGDVREPAFAPDHSRSASPGSTMYYPHTFTAYTSGAVSFTTPVLQATPDISGWGAVLYEDDNCSGTLEQGELQHSAAIAMDADITSQVCLIVQVFVPGSAPQSAQHAVTVAATFNYGGAPAADTVRTRNDLTTVGASGLVLVKVVDKPAAQPGEMLTYTITYSNLASEVLSDIIIDDKTPAFTTFNSASCVLPLPASLSGCAVTTQPPPGGTGAIQWTFDTGVTLQSGAQGQVQYQVTVDN